MGRNNVALQAICFLAATASVFSRSIITLEKSKAEAVGVQLGGPTRSRKLQEYPEDVCYEGCYSVPIMDPFALPLDTFLFNTSGPLDPVMMLDCYIAAADAGLQYFAIFDTFYCFGGNEPLISDEWARTECPLDCIPGSPLAGYCGDRTHASLFSMGECPVETDCPPPPPPPPPPPLPPAPPSPVPSFRCKPGIALTGTQLASSPVRLSNKGSDEANSALCQQICAADPACKGYYYKTTHLCYLMSNVTAWGKGAYKSAVKACRLT